MSYTLQEIFSKVESHLLTQNKQSRGVSGCKYRYRNLKCAVGCLIPDELYTKSIEGKGIFGLDKNLTYPLFKNKDDIDKGMFLLKELQHVHDNSEPCYWKSELKIIARRHDLAHV